MWGRRKREVAQLPQGWHDGTVAHINIVRRQGKQPGWDVLDVFSGELVAEFNEDELKDLLLLVNELIQNTAQESFKAIASAIPEHNDSPTNTAVAQVNFGTFTNLPQSANINRLTAFRQGWSQPPRNYIP